MEDHHPCLLHARTIDIVRSTSHHPAGGTTKKANGSNSQSKTMTGILGLYYATKKKTAGSSSEAKTTNNMNDDDDDVVNDEEMTIRIVAEEHDHPHHAGAGCNVYERKVRIVPDAKTSSLKDKDDVLKRSILTMEEVRSYLFDDDENENDYVTGAAAAASTTAPAAPAQKKKNLLRTTFRFVFDGSSSTAGVAVVQVSVAEEKAPGVFLKKWEQSILPLSFRRSNNNKTMMEEMAVVVLTINCRRRLRRARCRSLPICSVNNVNDRKTK